MFLIAPFLALGFKLKPEDDAAHSGPAPQGRSGGGSGSSGGGLYASSSYVEFQSCLVDTNTATISGGGIYADNSSTIKLVSTTLKQGDASQGGGLYAA